MFCALKSDLPVQGIHTISLLFTCYSPLLSFCYCVKNSNPNSCL